ncbi:hypothetical protein ScPMuIL_016255 [Solemya velum]
MDRKLVYSIFSAMLLFATFVNCQDEMEGDEEEVIGGEITEEEGVLVLTEGNFDTAIGSHNIILVEFYAPWCGHCKKLAPEYSKAAETLKEHDPPVVLAKVDATEEKELGSRFGISGYPTLKFFKNGEVNDYEGPRDADGIVSYMQERADPNWKPPPPAVVELTSSDFRDFVDRSPLSLVEFYAPWCGHCKRLAPEFEKAAQRLKNLDPPIPLAKVDATQENQLAKEFDVTGYPTLLVFRFGRPSEYKGPRESDGIANHMIGLQSEATKLLSSLKDVKNLMRKDDVTVIGFFERIDDPEIEEFKNAAEDFRDVITFGHTVLSEARAEYKVNPNSVVVFNAERFYTKFERKWYTMEKKGMKSDEIKEFVNSHDVPLVGEYMPSVSERYEAKKPLCLFFYTVDWSFDHRKATNIWRTKIAAIAKDYKKITFAIADEDNYSKNLEELKLSESGEELNVGCYDENNKKYPMDPMEEYEEDEIREYLDAFSKGKLEPVVKSQPIPKRQEGPVTVVVGKSFQDIVLDEEKDVLIEFYAPWCGHCKKLEPEYKKLAKKFQKEKKIVIAKMDSTVNDAPDNFKTTGFPTIYFAPATDKANPIKYEGDRSIDDISKFIKKHATVSFKKEEL